LRKLLKVIMLLLIAGNVSLNSQENVQPRIGVVSFRGNNLDRELINLSGLKENIIFNLDYLESGIDNIIVWYEENGYPYCEVILREIEKRNTMYGQPVYLDIGIDINEGEYITLDSFVVQGNKSSREELIVRESGLRKGEKFSQTKIQDALLSLSRLPYIEKISTIELISFRNKGSGILIDVQESPMSNFQGIFGYFPSTGTTESYIVGSFNISMNNLFGTGRAFTAYWEKKDRSSQDLSLNYKEPWIFGLPFHLDCGIEQVIQDSTFVKRNYTIGVRYTLNNLLSSYVSFKSDGTFPDDYGREAFGLHESRGIFVTSGIDYDTRDNFNNPTRGIRYASSFSLGSRSEKETDKAGSYSEKYVDVSLELALPVKQNNILFLRGHGAKIKSTQDILPYSQLLTLGGAKSLRGYRERQFRSSFIGLVTLEYRYILSKLSRFFLFFDTGFFQNENTEGKPIEKRFGYGWGMRVETRVGVLGFDYGLGKGDSIMRGKFHFTLENKF